MPERVTGVSSVSSAPSGGPMPSLPVVRCGIAGVLMGLANLVPGVSGGTMILVMGLYDEFVISVAEVTRLRFGKRRVAFLGILTACAALTVVSLAGAMSGLLSDYRAGMLALFIGMTLGGVPPLVARLKRPTLPAKIGFVSGFVVIVVIVLSNANSTPTSEAGGTLVQDRLVMEPTYIRDALAGGLAICAMVLPGISGAYVLLLLGRYGAILSAIAEGKECAISLARDSGSLDFLHVLIPVSVGALASLVLASNFLKWMLHHHPQPTLGALLGILIGSVLGLWPFQTDTSTADYLLAGCLATAGFLMTFLLSRITR